MGYASYIDSYGRPAGYSIEAECDHPSCTARIDRGVAYRCGSTGDDGCAKFFCYAHLLHAREESDGAWSSFCDECAALVDA